MILHTILPPELVLDRTIKPSGSVRAVSGGYVHLSKGGKIIRFDSTDPLLYLKTDYQLGRALPARPEPKKSPGI